MHVKHITLDPSRFFLQLAGERNVCFLKSTTSDGWGTVIAFNPADMYACRAGEKNNFNNFLQRNIQKGRKLIGYFSYDFGYELYGMGRKAKNDLRLPDIFFLAFDNWIAFKGTSAELHFNDPDFLKTVNAVSKRKLHAPPQAHSRNFTPGITKRKYEQAFKKIKHYIYEGEIYQINLTHRLHGTTTLPPRNLFAQVVKANPVDFLAYIEGEGFEILSASPERFVKIKDREIVTCPIKGTRPRGRTRTSDERNKQALLNSSKEAAELNMITDLLRNDLGRVCEIGSVQVVGSRILSKCPTVWHTFSDIRGRVASQLTPVEALISMLPGGSVTGCPKKRAMEIIDELEPTTRSVYTGVIGCIDPNVDLDFSIAIRTIIKKGEDLYLQVGGGIVHDSAGTAEFKETLAKAKSFMSIL